MLLYQVVETFNSYCAKFQKFVNPMSIMRAQEMLLVTSSIHNTALREKKYEKVELSHGKGNVGLDVWRRETSLDEELTVVAAPRQVQPTVVAAPRQVPASSQAVAHAAAASAAAAVPSASARTPSEAAILDGEPAFVAAPRQVQPTVITAPRQVPAAFQAPSQAVAHAAAATSATAAAAAVPAASTFTTSEASRLLRGVSQTPATDTASNPNLASLSDTPATDTASNPNLVSLSDTSSSESDTDVGSSTATSVPASRGSDSSSQNGSDSDSDVEVGSDRYRKRVRRWKEVRRAQLRKESGARGKQATEALQAELTQQEQLKVSLGGEPCFVAARCVTLVHADLPYITCCLVFIRHGVDSLDDRVKYANLRVSYLINYYTTKCQPKDRPTR